MDSRSQASSATSKSLLSRQLASIAETLARASQRRDEEMKRSRQPSGASTAPTRQSETSHGEATPMVVYLRGGGDDEENTDPYRTPRLEQWEKAETLRQERKGFEQTVIGSEPDDSERQKTVEFLLARSNIARMNEAKEVLRKRLEEEEEAVDEDEQLIRREKEVEEFEELMLKEEEDMEQGDYEERLRRWEEGRRLVLRMRAKDWARKARHDFLVKTNYGAQFHHPEDEKAELLRLEEELFQHLVAEMEAQDARELEVERKRQRSEEADKEGNKRSKSGTSPGDSTTPLSSDEREDEHSIPAVPQLRGGASIDEVKVAAAETAEIPGNIDAEKERETDDERRRRIEEDFQRMMAETKALDIEREARLRRAAGRVLRQEAARTSGYARDEEFEQKIAQMEAEDCERLEALQRQREGVQQSRAEEDARDISAEEEIRRRTESMHPEAERSYLLPPESPPDHSPPSYEASKFEARGDNTSHYDAVMRGGFAFPFNDDPGALLAELCSLEETIHPSDMEDNDMTCSSDELRQMLAEFERSACSTHAAATAYDDSQEILEELLTLSAPCPQELRSPTSENFEDDDDDEISTLRTRLKELRSLSDRSEPPALASIHFDEVRAETVVSADLPSEAIPYVVALALEHSECEWEIAQGWTRCLFRSGLDSYEARKEKEVAVAHTEEALQGTIVKEVETENCRKAEETKLPRRLIVTNLAAGADLEEMERQFWKYRYDITGITLLPDRDPLKRTRTAYVDFSSRKTAIEASYISGQVYGLIFHVKLAMPVQHASV